MDIEEKLPPYDQDYWDYVNREIAYLTSDERELFIPTPFK